ncbi:MAG: hypothetical protein GY892_12670 [Shimia sp.]|nr:hypothetical protein [Shimia sp.]
MQITFSPMRPEARLTLSCRGECLYVNGTAYDFSDLAEGDSHQPDGPESAVFAAPVRRCEGCVQVTLVLPHGPNASQETLFPDVQNTPTEGEIAVPLWGSPEGEASLDPEAKRAQ